MLSVMILWIAPDFLAPLTTICIAWRAGAAVLSVLRIVIVAKERSAPTSLVSVFVLGFLVMKNAGRILPGMTIIVRMEEAYT